MPARIASGTPERAHLLDGETAHARLLLELASRRVGEVLVLVDEAAGQRPVPVEGRTVALDEQDLERTGVDPEDHAIDGEQRRRGHSATPRACRTSCVRRSCRRFSSPTG